MARMIEIDGRRIGADTTPYVVAELSANHGGQIERAFAVMEAAKAAGADAVKLQTYTPDTLTIDCDRPEFVVHGGLWDGRKLYEALPRRADAMGMARRPVPQGTRTWHHGLFDAVRRHRRRSPRSARRAGLQDRVFRGRRPAADPARGGDAQAHPSLSTGMADLGEIAEAVQAAREAGCSELALLHCVSAYPAPAEDMNLRTIAHLAETFDVVTGLSDHTLGTGVAVTAVALGAAIIEKHVTLKRADGEPDATFSLEPDELTRLAAETRLAHAALGRVSYARAPSERANLVFRRSLYAVADISEGEAITRANVRSIRPGYGLAPKHLPDLLGRRAGRFIGRGTPLDWTLMR